MQLTLSNVLTIFGFLITIVTIITTNAKTQAVMDERIKNIQSEIKEMKSDIKEHNSYGKKFLEMQGDIKVLQTKVGI